MYREVYIRRKLCTGFVPCITKLVIYLDTYLVYYPNMKNIVPVSDLQKQAASILNEVRTSNEPVIITQRGRAAAVLVSAERFARIEKDLALLDELELRREIELAEKEIAEGKTISLEEAKRRLGYQD